MADFFEELFWWQKKRNLAAMTYTNKIDVVKVFLSRGHYW